MSQDVCLVTGVGPGTGAALARRFAKGYRVAMIARNEERPRALEAEIDGAAAFPCDVADESSLRATFEKIRAAGGSRRVRSDRCRDRCPLDTQEEPRRS